jgi:membrane protein YdbS with pleckstrin-like domain
LVDLPTWITNTGNVGKIAVNPTNNQLIASRISESNNTNVPMPPKPSAEEVTYYEENPSMFRNQPVWFVICCILSLVGVGLVIFFIWWLKCKGTTLTVTNDRTRLRKGILSKSVTEVWHEDIRNVQLDQTFFQRIFDVGTIGISSAGQSGLEISVSGMPNPDYVKELIDKNRRR